MPSRYEEIREEVRKKFNKDAKDHVVKEIRESKGLRYASIGEPGTVIYGYTLTTWPGHLAISGDMGTWVFSRLPDVFHFFRQSNGDINPSYWSEKLVAVDTHSKVREFDVETLRQHLRDLYEGDDERLQKYLDAIEHIDHHEEERDAIEALSDAGMEDSWDTSRTQYTHHFLWVCYAIVQGIAMYDERKTLRGRAKALWRKVFRR